MTPLSIQENEVIENAFSNSQSYTSYESAIHDIVKQLPCFEIGFTGVSKRNKRTTYCYPPTFIINATTSLTIPKLSGNYSWVQVTLNVTYSTVLEYLNRFCELYRKHLPSENQNGRTITWTDIYGYKMKTHNPNTVLVKRKELSGKLSIAVGQTMMLFWAGLGYLIMMVSNISPCNYKDKHRYQYFNRMYS